jgi:hypothetical protein
MDDELNARSLEYHRLPRPGQLTLATTKPLASQRDRSSLPASPLSPSSSVLTQVTVAGTKPCNRLDAVFRAK